MFRINTFEIHLPPLRERVDDIPTLAGHLLVRFRRGSKPGDENFTPEAMRTLKDHVWPGNVRELANVIEHATILCDEGPIGLDHLPGKLEARRLRPATAAHGPAAQAHAGHSQSAPTGVLTLREIEMQVIYQTLEKLGGNKPKAAEELGISLKTLYNKLNQSQGPLERSA
jgi:two-component system NtrC family response regulator